MEIKEAQKNVNYRIKELGGYWEPLSIFTRPVEEIGELGREMNLLYGGKRKKDENDGGALEHEFGDILFTILALGNRIGIDIKSSLLKKMKSDYKRDKKVYR